MDDPRKAFWDGVSAKEKAEAAVIDKAKLLLKCSAKHCAPLPDLRWIMELKAPAKTPAGVRRQMERMIKLFESLDYAKVERDSACVASGCAKESRAFFEARRASVVAEARMAIARADLAEAAKKKAREAREAKKR